MAPSQKPYVELVPPTASDNQKSQNFSVATRTFEVYVTGFGPFRNIQRNASYDIASTLPSTLPVEYLEPYVESNVTVNIHSHPESVHVAYDAVDTIVPEIYSSHHDADLFLHLGVAPILGYRLEQRARHAGYESPDVDDKFCPKQAARCHNCVPAGVEELWCGIDLDKIIARFDDDDEEERYDEEDDYDSIDPEDRAELKEEIERSEENRIKTKPYISNDAGLYLCEYIYFNSMAEAIFVDKLRRSLDTATEQVIIPKIDASDIGDIVVTEQRQNIDHQITTNETRPLKPSTNRVLFLHVPWKGDDEAIKLGRETVMRIIGGAILQKLELS